MKKDEIKQWREFCAADKVLRRWTIGDLKNPCQQAPRVPPRLNLDMHQGDLINIITTMMTQAGFWVQFNGDPYSDGMRYAVDDVITAAEHTWNALSELYGGPEMKPLTRKKTPEPPKKMTFAEMKKAGMTFSKEALDILEPMEDMRLRLDKVKRKVLAVAEPDEDYGVESNVAGRRIMSIEEEMKFEDLLSSDDDNGKPVRTFQVQTAGSNWEPKQFDGKGHDVGKARDWLRRFKAFSKILNLDAKQKCELFPMYLKGQAADWFKQLPREEKKIWKELKLAFASAFCDSGESYAKRYWSAKQSEKNDPQQHFWKLNQLGTKTGKDVRGVRNKKDAEEHLKHYFDTLHDDGVKRELRNATKAGGNTFRALERAIEEYMRDLRLSGEPSTKPKPSMKRIIPPKVAALHIEDEESDSERSRAGSESDSSEEEVQKPVRVAMTEKNRPKQSKLISRAPCTHCGGNSHDDDHCWSLITCRHCGRHHPDAYCRHVCKACAKVHEKGECELEKFFNGAMEWFDPKKHAGLLPKEMEEALKSFLNRNAC